jgi:hypothetical protein
VVPFIGGLAAHGLFFVSLLLAFGCCTTSISLAWVCFRPHYVIVGMLLVWGLLAAVSEDKALA